MDNFELHQRAQEMSDSHSAYELAREVLSLQQALHEAQQNTSPEFLHGVDFSMSAP